MLSINTANADFLQRLFATQEFEYTTQDANTLNYSLLAQQNCIILNELKIPTLEKPNALDSTEDYLDKDIYKEDIK